MKQYYESEVLFQLMERDGFNIPSSVPPYESEIKAYLINQVKQAYPKLTDYEAEWLLYNYTKHLPAEFPISSVSDVTEATFENVVPFAYQSAILKGNTKYRDIDTGDILDTFDETKNLELVSVKVPVLTTTGKNLFDKTKITKDYVIYSSGELTKNIGNAVSDYIKIEKNKTYIKNSPSSIAIYDVNKIFIERLNSTNVVTASNDGYIRWNISDYANTVDSLQIEEGTTATTYEPYKSNILTVNEDVSLHGIGDVKDELNLLNGEVTQRINEVVLDGSEGWTIATQNYSDGYIYQTLLPLNSITKNNIVCDKLQAKTVWGDNTGEGIAINNSLNYLQIKHSTITKVADFKAWLASSPITVQYGLEKPIIKTVDLTTVNESGESIHFMPLEGTMSVQSSGESIQPTFDMSVPVEATTQNLASFIDLEMEE